MHALLIYDYVEDIITRRAAFRGLHLSLAWQWVEQGEILLGGATGDPVDGAVLLFNVETLDRVQAFVDADPYFQNGLVVSYRILPWHTVVGDLAVNPVRL